MANDIEHLLLYLLANRIASFFMCLFKSLTYFSFDLSVFFLICCKHSLYILDISSFWIYVLHKFLILKKLFINLFFYNKWFFYPVLDYFACPNVKNMAYITIIFSISCAFLPSFIPRYLVFLMLGIRSIYYANTNCIVLNFHFLSFFLFFVFCLFRTTPVAYGGSQARGLIGAVAASQHHSHSNTGIRAMSVTYTTAHGNARSLTHWARPGIKPTNSCFLVGFVSAAPWWERQKIITFYSNNDVEILLCKQWWPLWSFKKLY